MRFKLVKRSAAAALAMVMSVFNVLTPLAEAETAVKVYSSSEVSYAGETASESNAEQVEFINDQEDGSDSQAAESELNVDSWDQVSSYASIDENGYGITGQCGANLIWHYDKDERVMTISGAGKMWNDPAFEQYNYEFWGDIKEHVYTIIIEDGVTSIGNNAFNECRLLTSIYIPDSVTKIGEGAFGSCIDLNSVRIPNGVTSIELGTFFACRSLTNIKIPNTVTRIEEGAFQECNSLEQIVIPESVNKIGRSAFAGCKSLKSINLPEKISRLEEYTFFHCYDLVEVNIPEYVKFIGPSTFAYCSSLERVMLPDGITNIGPETFLECFNLASIVIPDNVVSIEEGAFRNCEDLRDVTILNDDCDIADDAFSGTPFWERTVFIKSSVPACFETIGKSDVFAGSFLITSDPSRNRTVSWTSSNPAVFRLKGDTTCLISDIHMQVDIYGDALAFGKSTITITTDDGVSCSFDVNVGGEVGMLTKWDPQTQKASIGGILSGTYLITEETVLPDKDLSSMVGEYVLVAADSAEGSVYGSKRVILIQPVVSRMGTLTDVTDSSVTIDGEVYPLATSKPTLMGGEIQVVYHMYQDLIISIMFPYEKKGKFDAWSLGVATIDGIDYPVSNLTDKSFLNHVAQWMGWDVKFLILDGVLISMSQTDGKQMAAKQFQSYDQASRRVFFNDNTSYLLDSNTMWDSTGLVKNCWVLCTIQNTSKGIYLTKLEKVTPVASVDITINHGSETEIEYNDKKFRFVGGEKYQGVSSFEIPYSVTIKNATTVNGILYSGVSQSQLQSDDTLSFMVNDVTAVVSDGFNFGKNGKLDLKKQVKLAPGESISASGYIYVDKNYKLGAAKKDYAITITADTSLGKQSGSGIFTVTDKNVKEEETKKDIAELAKIASTELSQTASMGLRADKMDELGIDKKDWEFFEKELLTEIILSNVPEKTFDQKVNDEILKKVLSYKPKLGAESYELPLFYVIETEKYGTVNLKITCNITNMLLTGSKYACSGAVYYEIIDSDRDMPVRKKGDLGGFAYADVKAFADAAYNLAEAEIKNAYDLAWGNSAEEVSKFLFSDTATKILEACDTSYKNVTWDLMTWPAKNMKNSCPTNIYIYNHAGELCGAVENGQITKQCDEFELVVEGDVKYVIGMRGEYYIEYVATADGSMDVEVTEFSDYETPIRYISHKNVPLTVGKSYKQDISEVVLMTPKGYKLSANSGEEVLPDQDDVLVEFAVVEDIPSEKTEQRLEGTGHYTKNMADQGFYLDTRLTQGNGKLTYVSSNTEVATVSEAGFVIIKGIGEAEITITALETQDYKLCEFNVSITVTENPENKPQESISAKGRQSRRSSYFDKAGVRESHVGITTIDIKKGYVNSQTGIITGNEIGYSKWEQDLNGWKLLYSDGTYAVGIPLVNSSGKFDEQIFWEQINGAWYAFGADGYIKSGFIYDYQLAGWFYVDINIGMLVGWQFLNGKWYYFNPVSDGTKGKMFTDAWADQYYLNPAGEWEENKEKPSSM